LIGKIIFHKSVVSTTRKNKGKMAKRHYDPEVKAQAIQRYLNGESSYAIAKDLGLPYPDLVRKWAEAWRKQHGISAENYRKEGIAEEVDEIMKLRNIIKVKEEELDILIKALSILARGEISDWEGLKMLIKSLYNQQFR
jgi:transposase-like protein